MGAIAVYELLLLAFVTFAGLTTKPTGLPWAWLLAAGQLVAVVFAVRYEWLPMIVGILHWIGYVIIFQFREQHVPLKVALEHSSLDFSFIVLAVVCWLSGRVLCSTSPAQQ
jgi:hypothetical protein